MIAADLVVVLALPPGARVEQRVPKKLLVENGAPAAADKRRPAARIESDTEARAVGTLERACEL